MKTKSLAAVFAAFLLAVAPFDTARAQGDSFLNKQGIDLLRFEWGGKNLKADGAMFRAVEFIADKTLNNTERTENDTLVGTIALVVVAGGIAYALSKRSDSDDDGPCRVPSDIASDGSRCGDRAASVRPGGD